jgi:hypothetical protein
VRGQFGGHGTYNDHRVPRSRLHVQVIAQMGSRKARASETKPHAVFDGNLTASASAAPQMSSCTGWLRAGLTSRAGPRWRAGLASLAGRRRLVRRLRAGARAGRRRWAGRQGGCEQVRVHGGGSGDRAMGGFFPGRFDLIRGGITGV